MPACELSIIFPAHNEERRIEKCLETTLHYLASQYPRAGEVVVVENGSADRTCELARSWQEQYDRAGIRLQVFSIPVRGKGAAVKAGMLAASGECRLVSDVDLSVSLYSLGLFMDIMYVKAADVVIASREAGGAQRLGEPFFRHWMGRAFNLLVQTILLPGVEDSQCGFKLFSRRAAEFLFAEQKLTGMAFDAEVLYLALKYGFSVHSLPVRWTHDEYTVVRPLSDSVQMALDLLKVRLSDLRGLYPSTYRKENADDED